MRITRTTVKKANDTLRQRDVYTSVSTDIKVTGPFDRTSARFHKWMQDLTRSINASSHKLCTHQQCTEKSLQRTCNSPLWNTRNKAAWLTSSAVTTEFYQPGYRHARCLRQRFASSAHVGLRMFSPQLLYGVFSRPRHVVPLESRGGFPLDPAHVRSLDRALLKAECLSFFLKP